MPAIIKARPFFVKVFSHHNLLWCETSGEIYSPNAVSSANSEKEKHLPSPSIPAKAGISAAKQHSPKATIAMFRFAENSRCRENEIPAFAGMEGLVELAAAFSFGQKWRGEG